MPAGVLSLAAVSRLPAVERQRAQLQHALDKAAAATSELVTPADPFWLHIQIIAGLLANRLFTSASCFRMGFTRCVSGRVRLVSSCGIHMNQIQGGRLRSSTALASSSPTTPAAHGVRSAAQRAGVSQQFRYSCNPDGK
eukprot:GHRQ01036947.1.p1 GENE.GHRQ01036947.1~~GHRQ01036947.1.p1  ORF type:complete len:139 (+),score=23.18 GHRQ01036947.1:244-660(+)